MAGEMVDELLVGLSLQTDKQSFDTGISAFGAVRSAAMGMAAVVGGVSLDSLTRGFADSRQELGNFADLMEVTAQQVRGIEFAFQQVGGTAEEARGLIRNVVSLRDSLIRGDGSEFNALAAIGLDPRTITDAEDAQGAIENIMRDIQGMSDQRQRLILSELGAGSGEAFQLFEGGVGQFREFLRQAAELAPVTEAQVDAARELNRNFNELSTAIEGVAAQISEDMLPALTSFTSFMTDWIEGRQFGIGEFDESSANDAERRGFAAGTAVGEGIRAIGDWLGFGDSETVDPSGSIMLMRSLQNNGLTEEEMNVTPSAGDLIPPSEAPSMPSRGEMDGDAMERLNRIRQRQERGEFTPQDREYLREQMRQQFPERYQGNVTINIEGAGDPRAVAMEVDRRLTEHAGRASDAFRSSVV